MLISQKFHNSSFSNILSKMYKKIFLEVYYRRFSDKLPTILKYSKNTFLTESVFVEVRTSGLQGCSVFGIFEILEHLLLSKHIQTVSVVQCCIRATLIIGNSTTCDILIILQSFRRSFFKTLLWNHLWQTLVEFWAADYSPLLYEKLSRGETSRTKMDSYFCSNLQQLYE